jgi:hypothetical protein
MFRRDVLKIFGLSLVAPTLFLNKRTIKEVVISTEYNLEQIFEHGQLQLYEHLLYQKPDIEIKLTYNDGLIQEYKADNKKWITKDPSKPYSHNPHITENFQAEIVNNTFYMHFDNAVCVVKDLQRC